MAKSTKYFDLFSALRAGGDKGVSPEALQKATGFNQGALAVYIHALRHQFGAVIESVRNGRSVVAYRLTNADEVKITAARKPRVVTKTKKAAPKKQARVGVPGRIIKPAVRTAHIVKTTKVEDGSIPVIDDLDICEIGANELDDIRHSLGI